MSSTVRKSVHMLVRCRVGVLTSALLLVLSRMHGNAVVLLLIVPLFLWLIPSWCLYTFMQLGRSSSLLFDKSSMLMLYPNT